VTALPDHGTVEGLRTAAVQAAARARLTVREMGAPDECEAACRLVREVWSATPAPLRLGGPCCPILLNDVLQPLQRRRPQLGQHLACRVEAMRVERIQASYSVTALAQQTGFGKHLEVVTDGLLSLVEVRRDLTGGQLTTPHQPKDLPAMLIGERSEDGVRSVILAECARRRTAASCAHDAGDLNGRSPTGVAAHGPRGERDPPRTSRGSRCRSRRRLEGSG